MDIETLLAGPGDRTAALATSHGLGAADAAVRVAEAERFHEDKEDLAGELAQRWGEPHHIGMQTVRLRTATEEIPAPWAELSLRVADVYLWQLAEDGRWVALGVADLDPDDEIELLVVVTETDPP
ncbi:hypothetical protein [Streptomyces sp. NBC_00582]|uniref:hypothetical protein n=1 Tax=Streptomyces sp. NBC_00582 TaxID=2975783 RepID=UPI00106462C8|nr:hypothetical protein [Streptomyces sp. NBC_00582]WUB66260.1 hypothetical protein OG852_40505 [Streptomyces sp. NBC_00582]